MPTMVVTSEASRITGLPYSALRRLILEGKFTGFIRIGSRYYINLQLLEAFLNTPADDNAKTATVAGIRR